MIAIVDYNMGNLASVKNAFSLFGNDAVVESDPDKLAQYDKIILPGVGAYGDAMVHLEERGMKDAVIEFSKSGKWMMGICLGMQLLFDKSQEFGETQGLGLIPGEIVKFDEARTKELKVPHMGWNQMQIHHHSKLFEGLEKEFYLYFVHSFHAVTDKKYEIGSTHYGYEFTSAVQNDNILGFQPHPKKSHENGLKILKNFIGL